MKTDAQYKQAERDRKKAEGKKRIEAYVYPVDIPIIRQYINGITEKTKKRLTKLDRSG